MLWNKQKKSINFISPDLWPPTALTSVRLRCHAAASLSNTDWECRTQEATGWSLEQNIIDTAINKWRKDLHACVRTKGWYYEHLLYAVGQLDNWIRCQPKWQKSGQNMLCVCVLFQLNNRTTLNTNGTFRLFWFPQVVQEQTLVEVGTWVVIWWPVVSLRNIRTKNTKNY